MVKDFNKDFIYQPLSSWCIVGVFLHLSEVEVFIFLIKKSKILALESYWLVGIIFLADRSHSGGLPDYPRILGYYPRGAEYHDILDLFYGAVVGNRRTHIRFEHAVPRNESRYGDCTGILRRFRYTDPALIL